MSAAPLPPPVPVEGAWAPFLDELLGRWHGAGPARPAATEVRERLAEQPAAARPRLLELLRRELARPLSLLIHPSWLVPCLPRDPLLRCWVLAGLPVEVRHPLLQALGGEPADGGEERAVVIACQAPDWLAEWWDGELERLLAYPRPLPEPIAGSGVLERLCRLSPRDLVRALQLHGLYPLAAALAAWSRERQREEVVAAAFRLPGALRRRLVEISRSSAVPAAAAAAWGARGDRLRAGAAADAGAGHLPLSLALVDVAANATASGRRDAAVRIAYRLPRELGSALLAALGEDLAELAAADPAAWDRSLEEGCAELVRRGLLRWPEPGEGLP